MVAAVPFVVVGFQTWLANESLIDQAQRSHLLLAKTAADRVDQRLSALNEVVSALANNPQLYEDPQSASAQEALAGALLGRSQVLAVATYFADDQRDVLIQMARRPDASWLGADLLKSATSTYATAGSERTVITLMKATQRPGLRVVAAIAADGLSSDLNPAESGGARMVMQTRADVSGYRLGGVVPEDVTALAASSSLTSGASRFNVDGRTIIGAFSTVTDSPWVVVSVQPADEAERARAQMFSAALLAALVVTAMVIALSIAAWRWVLLPVRKLLAMQRQVLGGDGKSPRSDVADLRESFKRLKSMAQNRAAFERVFLDRYQVIRILGHGAMGSVFRAWDPKLCRDVAIKTVRVADANDSDDLTLRLSLQNEAVAFARVQHPNVVSVHDYLTREEFAFIVMEFVDGANLKEVLNTHQRLDNDEIMAIGVAVLRALNAAHKEGFLHRDIKPANVMLSLEGEVKLGDFGVAASQTEIARQGDVGMVGTLGYIAPECVSGLAASERSDLFALGNMLFQCLTGLGPMKAMGADGVANGSEHSPRAALERWIAALRATDPTQRPESAEAAMSAAPKADLAAGFASLARRIQPSAIAPLGADNDYRTRIDPGANR